MTQTWVDMSSLQWMRVRSSGLRLQMLTTAHLLGMSPRYPSDYTPSKSGNFKKVSQSCRRQDYIGELN